MRSIWHLAMSAKQRGQAKARESMHTGPGGSWKKVSVE